MLLCLSIWHAQTNSNSIVVPQIQIAYSFQENQLLLHITLHIKLGLAKVFYVKINAHFSFKLDIKVNTVFGQKSYAKL